MAGVSRVTEVLDPLSNSQCPKDITKQLTYYRILSQERSASVNLEYFT